MRLQKVIGAASAALALALAGCGSSETTSLMLDGSDTALTLERIKAYVWTGEWDVQLVVRRFPECQRRHSLAAMGDGAFKLEVFSPAPGAFIIKQGKHWFVTDLKSCALQEFKSPPPEPGMPVGSFVEKDGDLRFNKAPGWPPASPAAPAMQNS